MPTSSEPPFQSIAIIGLGLIGGSIALAVRDYWPSMRIVGVDDPAVVAHALGSGAIDRAVDNPAVLPASSLIVLAAPVRQNMALLTTIAAHKDAVITDVGGTKGAMAEAARALPESATFVGGHPLGGGERGGFAFARPDLFTGKPWIFTPHVSSEASAGRVDAALKRLSTFASGLGAVPTTMTPAEHDALMAYVSHLPQLAASALMGIVGTAATADGLKLAGKGLLDTTRLASSPADVWRDICATNAPAIGTALDQLIERLTELRADLERGDAIEVIFDDAARWRAELMKSRE